MRDRTWKPGQHSKPPFAVVDARMVACCALYLQNEEFDVHLVDRSRPGDGDSFGNLGSFDVASCPPTAMPGTPRKAPGMLLDADAPLKLHWCHAAKVPPWFLRFTATARRHRVEANAGARQSLPGSSSATTVRTSPWAASRAG